MIITYRIILYPESYVIYKIHEDCPESTQTRNIKNRGVCGWTFSRQPLYVGYILYILVALFIYKWYQHICNFLWVPWRTLTDTSCSRSSVFAQSGFHSPHLLPHSSSHWPFSHPFLTLSPLQHILSPPSTGCSLLGSRSLLFPVSIYWCLSP